MARCEKCGSALVLRESPVSKYDDEMVGSIRVELYDCVLEYSCATHPDVRTTEIPDYDGLIAAVAIERIKIARKLTGVEIRFLRNRALRFSNKQLADAMKVSEEAISRWENDKIPIGPTSEKLLRMVVGFTVKNEKDDRAPLIDFDPLEIASMEIEPLRDSGKEHLVLQFHRSKVLQRHTRTTTTEWLTDKIAS
jgi:transcriptional regulator with XRE-family HTH domain